MNAYCMYKDASAADYNQVVIFLCTTFESECRLSLYFFALKSVGYGSVPHII